MGSKHSHSPASPPLLSPCESLSWKLQKTLHRLGYSHNFLMYCITCTGTVKFHHITSTRTRTGVPVLYYVGFVRFSLTLFVLVTIPYSTGLTLFVLVIKTVRVQYSTGDVQRCAPASAPHHDSRAVCRAPQPATVAPAYQLVALPVRVRALALTSLAQAGFILGGRSMPVLLVP